MSAEKPRLIAVESLPTLAGGQRALVDLLPALVEHFQVTVVVPARGPLSEALDRLQVPVVVFPMGRRYTVQRKQLGDVLTLAWTVLPLTVRLAHLIRRRDADLVLLNSTPAFPWGTLAGWLTGRPVVWYAHNLLADRKSLWLMRTLSRWPSLRAILAPTAEAAVQYRSRAHVAVIPPGVDTDVFQPQPDLRGEVRAALDLPAGAPILIMIADLIRLKGQHLAIQAARSLTARFGDLKLLIVGEARPEADSLDYERELRASAADSANVRFLGYRDDVPDLLAAADILIVASTMETGPLVLVQALACGVPAVSTPTGQAPALLADGDCGLLFPVGDAAALEQALAQVLTAPDRARMGQAGRRRVCLGWSLGAAGEQLVAALRAELD